MRITQTLAQVQETIERAKKTKADVAMARAIVKFGNCTDEAREFARQYVIKETTTLVKSEFPDFDGEMPSIPGFIDQSWHNDVCPVLRDEARHLELWCDYANPAQRENKGAMLYTLTRYCDEHSETVLLCESDTLSAILTAIAALGD